jgi:triacylglycerol lipase
LTYLRAFTEAIIAYTGAEKINIISHSMGVTLGRRVIKGGKVTAAATPFNLGPSLANKVDTFIGLAGATYGLTTCYMLPMFATCNQLNGFYPGYAIGPMGMSRYLQELNDDQIKEGVYVYSLFSGQDDLIGYGSLVWGRYTSAWPTTDTYKNYNYDIPCHMGLRD